MARKIQQLSIDGVTIDLSRARFADTFDVAESDERSLAFDEEVVYVVVARVSTPSFREARNGEVSRVNVLKVREARLVKNEDLKETLLERLNFNATPQPSLFDGLPEAEEVETIGTDGDLADVVRMIEGPQTEQDDFSEPEVVKDDDSDDGSEDGEPESDSIDDSLDAFLEITRRLSEELDDDALPEPEPTTGGRVVADARGMRAKDPILDRFLESTA